LLKHAIQNTIYLQSIHKKQFELQHLLQEGKIDKVGVNEDLAEKLSQLDAVIQKEMMQALADIAPKGK
jgi:guanylate kinase